MVILGAGESGIGAAKLAKVLRYDLFVSDFGAIKDKYKTALTNLGVRFEEKQHTEAEILSADIIIKSPGIPDKAPIIKSLKQADKEIIDEIEFASRHAKGKTIVITGSNGKTTTTLLTNHILEKAGYDVAIAGNVGKSWAGQLAEKDHDFWVVEVSSFQLDYCTTFAPDIAILCNITPDHLDRYEYKLENYAKSKFRIAQNQTEQQYFIYCADDEETKNYMHLITNQVQRIPFTLSETLEPEQGAFVRNNQIIINPKHQKLMSIHDLALQGKHNLYNSMASAVAGRIAEVRKDVIRESLSDFQGVEHRLEFVATVHGIDFINDSKATNVNSTWYALESVQKPTIWIVGGVDKGNDYSSLLPLVQESVKAIICLGEDNQKILDFFQDKVETIVEAKSAKQAVELGYRMGTKGDQVLLSPACASFDLFESYEDRGNQFKRYVRAL